MQIVIKNWVLLCLIALIACKKDNEPASEPPLKIGKITYRINGTRYNYEGNNIYWGYTSPGTRIEYLNGLTKENRGYIFSMIDSNSNILAFHIVLMEPGELPVGANTFTAEMWGDYFKVYHQQIGERQQPHRLEGPGRKSTVEITKVENGYANGKFSAIVAISEGANSEFIDGEFWDVKIWK